MGIKFLAERWCRIVMKKTTTFGQWLKQRRKVFGLTQKQLAQLADVYKRQGNAA